MQIAPTRSLADFAKLVELFDAHGVSFVSVTQQFNTTTSMGRLTLNVLLSFAQFERLQRKCQHQRVFDDYNLQDAAEYARVCPEQDRYGIAVLASK